MLDLWEVINGRRLMNEYKTTEGKGWLSFYFLKLIEINVHILRCFSKTQSVYSQCNPLLIACDT